MAGIFNVNFDIVILHFRWNNRLFEKKMFVQVNTKITEEQELIEENSQRHRIQR